MSLILLMEYGIIIPLVGGSSSSSATNLSRNYNGLQGVRDQNMLKKSKFIFSGNAAIAKLGIDLLTLDGNLRQSV